jgi:hypothetical protein
MKASDVDFFMRYHAGKATELKEGIMHVLRETDDALTRDELLAKLPEGAHSSMSRPNSRKFSTWFLGISRARNSCRPCGGETPSLIGATV